MRILVTGFEPFGGSPVNASAELARGLDGRRIGGAEVAVRVVPVRWYDSIRLILAAIEELRPEAVLMFGQAGARGAVGVERIGINVCEGLDNTGEAGGGRPVVAGGPDGIFSRLPLPALVGGLRAGGVPAELSNSAGTFLCNHVAYGVPQALATGGSAVRSGFIHVPMLPEQVVALRQRAGRAAPARGSLPPEMLQRAGEIAVAVTADALDRA